MDNMERSFKIIQDLIDKAFGTFWDKDKPSSSPTQVSESLYESIEEYTSQTGKRFRMTKEQKSRGLSRSEAFSEFVETLS